VKKRRINGIFGNQSVDEKWRREMFELQQQILDNQGKILEHMNGRTQSAAQQQTADLSNIESKLEKLCESIGLLNETLKKGLSRANSQISVNE